MSAADYHNLNKKNTDMETYVVGSKECDLYEQGMRLLSSGLQHTPLLKDLNLTGGPVTENNFVSSSNLMLAFTDR